MEHCVPLPEDGHNDGSQPPAPSPDIGNSSNGKANKPAPAWSEELADFILGLTTADLPPAPFMLDWWDDVFNSERYLAWLQRDIALGPRSPRARYGVLHNDMERLRDIVFQHRGTK